MSKLRTLDFQIEHERSDGEKFTVNNHVITNDSGKTLIYAQTEESNQKAMHESMSTNFSAAMEHVQSEWGSDFRPGAISYREIQQDGTSMQRNLELGPEHSSDNQVFNEKQMADELRSMEAELNLNLESESFSMDRTDFEPER